MSFSKLGFFFRTQEASRNFAEAYQKHLQDLNRPPLSFSGTFPLFFASLRSDKDVPTLIDSGRAQLVPCEDHISDALLVIDEFKRGSFECQCWMALVSGRRRKTRPMISLIGEPTCYVSFCLFSVQKCPPWHLAFTEVCLLPLLVGIAVMQLWKGAT